MIILGVYHNWRVQGSEKGLGSKRVGGESRWKLTLFWSKVEFESEWDRPFLSWGISNRKSFSVNLYTIHNTFLNTILISNGNAF